MKESFISRLNTTLVIILLKLTICGVASGQWHFRHQPRNDWGAEQTSRPFISGRIVVGPSDPEPYTGSAKSCEDALDEVNKARARRGLKPFLPDKRLNEAAWACAQQRAARLISGHLPESDFHYLKGSSNGVVGGCAAWIPEFGFGACDLYSNHKYCGASWVLGKDNKRYMHCFYRD